MTTHLKEKIFLILLLVIRFNVIASPPQLRIVSTDSRLGWDNFSEELHKSILSKKNHVCKALGLKDIESIQPLVLSVCLDLGDPIYEYRVFNNELLLIGIKGKGYLNEAKKIILMLNRSTYESRLWDISIYMSATNINPPLSGILEVTNEKNQKQAILSFLDRFINKSGNFTARVLFSDVILFKKELSSWMNHRIIENEFITIYKKMKIKYRNKGTDDMKARSW
jgi:hypothetical protein